jgi:tetratricopeptide (TPR) repeat protein
VIDLMKSYCRIDGRDDPRAIRAKVTGQVLTLDEGFHDTIPALLMLLEALPEDSPFLKLDPLQRRQRTLEALKRVLLRESQVQSLLLVFEDLHWIDAETQALLDSLVESLPTARLLLLVNYRPEYHHGWGHKTYYTQLRLDPLPPEKAEEFLQALLGDDARLEPLKQLLIERTEGNPFFLEESVRTLVETGVLAGESGAYRLAKPLASIQVPATVQSVLAARIDRLPSEEKRLLQTAAVIGTEVPLSLLQAIVEMSEEELRRGLAHLQAAEFLYETSLFPELAYTFKHALTHEVAYGSLLQERRRRLHARIVEGLEVLYPDRLDEQVERLAHHAFRGEIWDKAVTYCQQAGSRAWDRAALRGAVASFEQALQALAHLHEDDDTRGLAIELRLALDRPLNHLGEYGQRRALLGEAEALARALDDQARLVQVLARMAQVLRQTGEPNGAMAAGQQARALAAALGDSALQAQASYYLGQAYFAIGDFGRAADLLRWSVAAVNPESGRFSTDVRIQSQAWLAWALSAHGAFTEGRQNGEEALRLATLAGRGNAPVCAHGCLGLLYLAQGDLDHAIRVFDQGLALCRASGNRDWLRPIVAGLGYASALAGRLGEGRALLEEGISESTRTGGLHGQAHRVAWLSEVCRLEGHGEEAWQHAHQALDLARQQKDRGDEALVLHQVGIVYAHADPPDIEQAEAHYQQALALAEELGMRPLVSHCHLGLGTLYTKGGRREQACVELSTAIELYRAMDMTFWLPQAEVVLAQVV